MYTSDKIQYPTLFVPAPSQTAPVASETTYAQNQSGQFSLFNPGSQQASNGESGGIKSYINFSFQSVILFFSQRYRPWLEFFNTAKFGLPQFGAIIQRVQRNLNTFTVNYFCLSGVLLVSTFSLLLNLITLFRSTASSLRSYCFWRWSHWLAWFTVFAKELLRVRLSSLVWRLRHVCSTRSRSSHSFHCSILRVLVLLYRGFWAQTRFSSLFIQRCTNRKKCSSSNRHDHLIMLSASWYIYER